VGRILAWVAGALGVAGLAKALSKRQAPLVGGGPDPRADELRRRLEEAKPLAAEPIEDVAEVPVDSPSDVAPARTREDVHAKARAAIRDMQGSGGDEGGDSGREPPRDA
jgi:hypothetical protein